MFDAVAQAVQQQKDNDMTLAGGEIPTDLVTYTTELTSSIRLWSVKCRETVQTLRSLADELMEHHKNVHIAKVSGLSASI